MLASATAHYHDLVIGSANLAAESYGSLCDLQQRNHLTFGNKLICYSLRPQFIDQHQYDFIFATTRILASALYKLWVYAMQNESALEALCLSDEERLLLSVDPGYAEPLPNTRLDSFFTNKGWNFVEYNAEIPAAIGYEDRLARVFFDLPVMQAFRRRYHVNMLLAQHSLVNMMRDLYLEFAHNVSARRLPRTETVPHIAIVDWSGVPTASEFEIWREYLETQGIPTIITTPGALDYRSGRLFSGDFPIDFVYRRVLLHELLARPGEAAALLAAYRDGAICMMNSPRVKPMHKKMSLGMLSDPAYSYLFSSDELAVVRKHVPWTRRVQDGYCDYGGKHIDLLPFLQTHKDEVVLKPNDDYGGRGVVIGPQATQGTWEQVLQEALEVPYVVQQLVPLPYNDYPVYDVDGNKGVSFVSMAADIDPFLCAREPIGLLSRLSPSPLLNVTAGAGSLVPTFVIEER